jgi:hypothetical protein
MQSNKEQLIAQLKEHISKALESSHSDFKKPFYGSLIEKITTKVLTMFEKYASLSRRDKDYISQSYPKFERDLLISFLSSAPNATGSSTLTLEDRLENEMNHTLGISSVDLGETEARYLKESSQEALRIYAGLAKIGLEKDADEAFRARVERMMAGLEATLSEKENKEVQNALQGHIEDALKSVSGLRSHQKHKIADQVLWLFRDYVLAPDEEKDEVYSRGEERIILSTFEVASRILCK